MPALAQYPGRIQKKVDAAPPLRATAIYEWTGDLKAPKAGRLVPLAVWDGQDYQPGALYLAQPAPLALLTGTVYELQDEGSAKALFTVKEAENINGVAPGNWWIGIGILKLDTPAPKTSPTPPKHFAPIPVKEGGSNSDRPVLHRRDSSGDSSDKGTATPPPVDPDRPTLHRKDTSDSSDSDSTTTSGSQSGSSSGSTSASSSTDPERPTLHRKDNGDNSSGSGNTNSGSSGSASNAPQVDPDRPTMHRKDDSAATDTDPDRPTLHRRSDKDSGSPMSTTAPVDPDRPRLRRGMMDSPTGIVEPAKLAGLPADMKQLVAVSDAQEGTPHSFLYSWAEPEDAAKMQTAMEDIARKALEPATPQNVTVSATKATRVGTKPTTTRKKSPTAAPVLQLEDESFRAFELSYSGGATLVLTAKTTDASGNAKYITLIAQPDFYGTPQVIFKQMTSDDQLEITPRMLLVDALDTNADNRAELVFELRGKTTRAFAIYSVVNARAEEAFNTGILPRIR